MFLGMRDFDFCLNQIKFYPVYLNFTQICPNFTQIYQNFTQIFAQIYQKKKLLLHPGLRSRSANVAPNSSSF